MTDLFGRWRLEVTKAIHTWENWFRIEGASSGNGGFDPTVGSVLTADGAVWKLIAEHRQNSSDPWTPSDMQVLASPDRVDIRAIIGAEDPLPQRDFEDIEWDARWLGETLFDIPVRPFAVRISDLGQMPDGIFETAIGIYYMAVRVTNQWGLPFGPDHSLSVTPQSRAILSARGIRILDTFSQRELDGLGQTLVEDGIGLDGLTPGASRTVYFKIDVRDAAPRKHEIEFALTNRAGMADPTDPRRFRKKQIFVSRSFIDEATGQIVSEVQEGEVRVQLREVAIDRPTAKRTRRRLDGSAGKGGGKRRRRGGDSRQQTLKDLRRALDAVLNGRDIDPCLIHELLACACACPPGGRPGNGDGSGDFDPTDPWGGGRDPRYPNDGKYQYPPFYAFPTKFDYTVTPREPCPGQYGPIPFDDPWWKVLLIIVAVVLLVAGMIAEAADIAYQDEDLVIGTLGSWQQNDLDAAVCIIDTDRLLAAGVVLDAFSDEDNQDFIQALNGNIAIDSGNAMTHAEITALLALPLDDPARKVFKSGATTGLTRGIISALAPVGHSEATWAIDQVLIIRDPAFDNMVSNPGDSGSMWVQTDTLRPVGLHHSGDADSSGNNAFASLIVDVQSALNITI